MFGASINKYNLLDSVYLIEIICFELNRIRRTIIRQISVLRNQMCVPNWNSTYTSHPNRIQG